jgi:hypothetical protein
VAGADFAERAAGLAGDTGRMLTLFGNATFIDEQNGCIIGKRLSDQVLVLFKQQLWRSRAVGDKGLQGADGKAVRQGKRLDRFTWKLAEQAAEVAMRPDSLVFASISRCKQGCVVGYILAQPCDFTWHQGAGW